MVDLTIIVAIYNHEKYLEKAINSILSQNVNFRYEVLIGEDNSRDNSRYILRKLEKKLPNTFHVFYREHNYGIVENFNDLFEKSNGRYMIVLEGDDFWIDNNKLQIQYDFLEQNHEYIAISHDCKIVDEKCNEIVGEQYPNPVDDEYTIRDYEKGRLPGQTTTIMFRNYYKNKYFDYHVNSYGSFIGDRIRAFLLLAHGRIRYMDKKMSAYRHIQHHGESFSAIVSKMDQSNREKQMIGVYKGIHEYTLEHKYIDHKLIEGHDRLYLLTLIDAIMNDSEIVNEDDIKSIWKDETIRFNILYRLKYLKKLFKLKIHMLNKF